MAAGFDRVISQSDSIWQINITPRPLIEMFSDPKEVPGLTATAAPDRSILDPTKRDAYLSRVAHRVYLTAQRTFHPGVDPFLALLSIHDRVMPASGGSAGAPAAHSLSALSIELSATGAKSRLLLAAAAGDDADRAGSGTPDVDSGKGHVEAEGSGAIDVDSEKAHLEAEGGGEAGKGSGTPDVDLGKAHIETLERVDAAAFQEEPFKRCDSLKDFYEVNADGSFKGYKRLTSENVRVIAPIAMQDDGTFSCGQLEPEEINKFINFLYHHATGPVMNFMEGDPYALIDLWRVKRFTIMQGKIPHDLRMHIALAIKQTIENDPSNPALRRLHDIYHDRKSFPSRPERERECGRLFRVVGWGGPRAPKEMEVEVYNAYKLVLGHPVEGASSRGSGSSMSAAADDLKVRAAASTPPPAAQSTPLGSPITGRPDGFALSYAPTATRVDIVVSAGRAVSPADGAAGRTPSPGDDKGEKVEGASVGSGGLLRPSAFLRAKAATGRAAAQSGDEGEGPATGAAQEGVSLSAVEGLLGLRLQPYEEGLAAAVGIVEADDGASEQRGPSRAPSLAAAAAGLASDPSDEAERPAGAHEDDEG